MVGKGFVLELDRWQLMELERILKDRIEALPRMKESVVRMSLAMEILEETLRVSEGWKDGSSGKPKGEKDEK